MTYLPWISGLVVTAVLLVLGAVVLKYRPATQGGSLEMGAGFFKAVAPTAGVLIILVAVGTFLGTFIWLPSPFGGPPHISPPPSGGGVPSIVPTTLVQPFVRDPSGTGDVFVPFRGEHLFISPGELSIDIGLAATAQGSPHALVMTVSAIGPPGCPYDDVAPRGPNDFFAVVGVPGNPGHTYVVSVTSVQTDGVHVWAGYYTGTPQVLGCKGPAYGTSLIGALLQLGIHY
jgi:hypothetical protein